MSSINKIHFEGYTAEELLALPRDDFDAYVFCEDALVIDIGTANVLGKFNIEAEKLILELAQIDGGGEGVLIALNALAKKIAIGRNLSAIEWQVHAVHCAEPNLKLRRVLEKSGFEVKTLAGIGEVFHKIEQC